MPGKRVSAAWHIGDATTAFATVVTAAVVTVCPSLPHVDSCLHSSRVIQRHYDLQLFMLAIMTLPHQHAKSALRSKHLIASEPESHVLCDIPYKRMYTGNDFYLVPSEMMEAIWTSGVKPQLCFFNLYNYLLILLFQRNGPSSSSSDITFPRALTDLRNYSHLSHAFYFLFKNVTQCL